MGEQGRSKWVRDPSELQQRLCEARESGKTIVLTNGAFDLLHVGHVRCLEAARREGDFLVVGLNTDESVRTGKGPGRPVVTEDERAEVLSAFACVDLVTPFSEPTAEDLIRSVRPDVWAKGRDYSEATLPEAPVVRDLGARIAIVGDPKDHATSEIIDRVREMGGR